jgi:predicted PurR-regulated permease PerM
MLGIDRRAASYTWTAALILLLLSLLYLVRSTLFIFILALLFAYLLAPLVSLLDRFLPGNRTRTPALALAYIIFMGIVVLAGIQIGSRVVEEANSLSKRLPEMSSAWLKPASQQAPGTNSIQDQVVAWIRQEIVQSSNSLISALPGAGLKALTVASNLIFVVIIPILGFFFLKDGHVMRQHVLDMVADVQSRAVLDDVLADVNLMLASYIRALTLLALAAFTAYAIFFSILSVPYGVLLAALAGMLEIIPMVGPLVAGTIIFTVALLSGSHALAVLLFLLAYRVFQDYILSPHLMGQGVELHPLLVLFGVFAGAEIAGIPGTFLSVPVLALIRVVYIRIRKTRIGAQLSSGSEVAPKVTPGSAA